MKPFKTYAAVFGLAATLGLSLSAIAAEPAAGSTVGAAEAFTGAESNN